LSSASRKANRKSAGSSSRTPPRKTPTGQGHRRRKRQTKDDGKRLPLDVKAGDRILFGKYSGQEIKLDGEEYLIMRGRSLAVIDNAPRPRAPTPARRNQK
jgi:hypothetical protein